LKTSAKYSRVYHAIDGVSHGFCMFNSYDGGTSNAVLAEFPKEVA
jgi:hypothetical protein